MRQCVCIFLSVPLALHACSHCFLIESSEYCGWPCIPLGKQVVFPLHSCFIQPLTFQGEILCLSGSCTEQPASHGITWPLAVLPSRPTCTEGLVPSASRQKRNGGDKLLSEVELGGMIINVDGQAGE